ncbi:MAG: hypothetical protein AAFQ82_13045 [Myxococcota bacterium]
MSSVPVVQSAVNRVAKNGVQHVQRHSLSEEATRALVEDFVLDLECDSEHHRMLARWVIGAASDGDAERVGALLKDLERSRIAPNVLTAARGLARAVQIERATSDSNTARG